MNRLENARPDLYRRLTLASPDLQRRAARAAAEIALGEVGRADLAVVAADWQPSIERSRAIAATADRLDEHAWELHDSDNQSEYMNAFSQARAASSIAFALDPEPTKAAIEATYEATVAVPDAAIVVEAVSAVLASGGY